MSLTFSNILIEPFETSEWNFWLLEGTNTREVKDKKDKEHFLAPNELMLFCFLLTALAKKCALQ